MNASAAIQKICLLGTSVSGKTSIVRRYVFGEFEKKYTETLGTHITKRAINIEYEGKHYTIVNFIWDTPGAYFRGNVTIPISYLQGTSGIIGVYDCAKPAAFSELDSLMEKYKRICPIGERPIVFAANKVDLIAKTKRQKLPQDHIYVSAKTGENIEELFELLNKKVLAKKRSW